MKVPLIVISYGMFESTKKLFTYEEFGCHNFPVFTRPVIAALFMNSAKEIMHEILQDKPPLMTQLCPEAQYAVDMFEVINTEKIKNQGLKSELIRVHYMWEGIIEQIGEMIQRIDGLLDYYGFIRSEKGSGISRILLNSFIIFSSIIVSLFIFYGISSHLTLEPDTKAFIMPILAVASGLGIGALISFLIRE